MGLYTTTCARAPFSTGTVRNDERAKRKITSPRWDYKRSARVNVKRKEEEGRRKKNGPITGKVCKYVRGGDISLRAAGALGERPGSCGPRSINNADCQTVTSSIGRAHTRAHTLVVLSPWPFTAAAQQPDYRRADNAGLIERKSGGGGAGGEGKIVGGLDYAKGGCSLGVRFERRMSKIVRNRFLGL